MKIILTEGDFGIEVKGKISNGDIITGAITLLVDLTSKFPEESQATIKTAILKTLQEVLNFKNE